MSSVQSISVARLLAATCLTAALAGPALAQEASITPYPVRQYADENGVDLLSGAFTTLSPGISVGGEKGLTYQREVRGFVFRDSMTWNIGVSGSTYTVGLAGRSEAFTLSGGVYTPVESNGSTLTFSGGNYTFTAADGTVATFTTALSPQSFGNARGNVVTSVTYPSGRTLTFYYLVDGYDGGHGQTIFGRRLSDVTTNAGWHINFEYASNDPTPPGTGAWSTVITVKGLNSSVDTACNPPVTSCPITGRPVLNISGSTYTDAEGRVTTYTIVPGTGVTGVRLPGSASDDISVAYTSSKVSSITRFGVTTTYGYVDVSGIRTVTVTRPGGATRVATFDIAKKVMLSDQDELGRTTSYQYDTNNRPTRVTLPEGNYTQLTYDTRGNVTEKRMVAKAGSGLADIVLTAGYDATCTNGKTCNQPNWTKDAKLNQTDYTYDAGHGGILTVTEPAPTVGANRPQSRTTWSRLDVNGAVSATGIFVPTANSACQMGTSPSCVGTADEVKTTATYGYGYRLSAMSKGAGDNSLTATNAMTYDVIGNLTYFDGPLTGSADTVRILYNQDREPVGVIGPDPDGAGSLKNRAKRVTYGSTGLVTKAELGTTSGQSDADWSAFSPAQAVDVTYDVNRRPTTQKLNASYALTQASYDSRGRLQCTAVRMNPAAYGSLPSDACTLGTSGSYGPDRITRTNYDAASQIASTQTAYGTADQATERTLTYTNNGVLQTLLDAENNLTTYEYDGFDRLSKTRYPNTTKGSGTSSTTDYEQPGYDANSNVTSFRNRAAQLIGLTYDNLDRVTLKDLPGTEPDVTYAYDNLNRITSASQTGNNLAFTWDALSRRLTEVGPQGTATSEYDLANRRTKLTYPGTGLYVNYDYLVTGEVTKVRENGATSGVGVLATYGYDDLGNRTSLTFGNGVAQTFTFDSVSRLASLTNNLSGTTNDLTVNPIAYNPSSQITSTVRTGDTYAWTGHGNGSTAFTQNGLNQQITVGGVAATWDSKGNLTGEPQSGKTYGYSSENLLTSASGGVTLGYDPALRLYQVAGASTTRFAYDGVNDIAEYNGSNALQRRYVFGSGDDEALVQYEGTGTTDRRFMSADERGSIISLTDSAGALLNIDRYDEYGKPQSSNAGRFQYTGQVWLSELGAYYYKARVYLPHLGIFAQADPVGFEASPNLYAYVLNDPVNLVDPLGLDPLNPWCGSGCHVDPNGDVVVTAGFLGFLRHLAPARWSKGGGGNVGGDSGGGGGGSGRGAGGGGGGGDVTADRECTPGQVALQETGKIVSDLGGSITAGGAAAGAIGGIIAIGGALTGDVPAAGYGAIVMQRGANTIAVGGFVTYTGAFLQVAGGSPKAAAIAYVNNALVSRIPFVPLVGRTYVKMALKKMEQVLPNFDFCSR